MSRPPTTSEARAIAWAALRRIAEREASGTLNRINYAALTPVERLALHRKEKHA